MKKIFYQWFVVICCSSGIGISALFLIEPAFEHHQFLPQSGGTIPLMKEGGEEERLEQLKRLEWLEQIHKAAPGTDWRAMDRKTR